MQNTALTAVHQNKEKGEEKRIERKIKVSSVRQVGQSVSTLLITEVSHEEMSFVTFSNTNSFFETLTRVK